ncbi:uncharacterized protein DS421_18g626560 [Arachis hypogaea]|uniref:Uncharacterized protein n=1 Tax=Arachis hypogaea TaxID=3818 RepID=A0A444Y1D7_ARAHY|nr:uncharacterized protein DS421_18g626560 [Arachis hypogaea]RYQ95722.1 hypothetical protein Ahy_B08g091069 isoform C [Arachis hypogaea]
MLRSTSSAGAISTAVAVDPASLTSPPIRSLRSQWRKNRSRTETVCLIHSLCAL